MLIQKQGKRLSTENTASRSKSHLEQHSVQTLNWMEMAKEMTFFHPNEFVQRSQGKTASDKMQENKMKARSLIAEIKLFFLARKKFIHRKT